MGIADVKTSEFFEDNNFFADMGNAYFFQGRQIIKPELLQETNEVLNHSRKANSNKSTWDSVRKYFDKVQLCIYVLEHQRHIDYHMVIRNMLSEAMEYQRQWRNIKRLHKKRKDLAHAHEFISGMKKAERFIPVVMLVVYYGEERWDAARSLHELLETSNLPEGLQSYISDYRIHVFDYHDYDNFDMFQTELKQVFTFLKHSADKDALKELILDHPEEYHNISREACELIAVLTKSEELLKLELYENTETGGINMCKALVDIREEGRMEGHAEGCEEKARIIVRNMLKREMPEEDICALAECSPNLVAEIRTML